MSAPALNVAVRRVRAGGQPLPLPMQMSAAAAGVDLLADIEGDVALSPGGRVAIPTGIAVAIPLGFEGQVRPRSGWARRDGVTVLNTPGTIDADYRGEIQVVLVNLGDQAITIRRGDRVAQLVVAPVVRVVWHEVAELEGTERGERGFGSTDRR